MGWGMGIGIGWPAASSQGTPGQMVYFVIAELCGGAIDSGETTQLVNNSIYQTGDYVETSPGTRVLLGAETLTIGTYVRNISGPVYTSCPV